MNEKDEALEQYAKTPEFQQRAVAFRDYLKQMTESRKTDLIIFEFESNLQRMAEEIIRLRTRIDELEGRSKDDALMDHEMRLSLKKYISQADVREELRLLADSMSTHAALANKMGISPQYLHDVIRGRREPGPKVLKFLKLRRVIVYVDGKP